jgi:RNA polymerase sigma factor (sigma-70 family)
LPLTAQLRDPRPAPDAEAHALGERERLLRAIRSLPESLRQVVLLHLEGATPGEIAAVQGITENNASVRLTRARQALRDFLDSQRRS